MRLMTLLFRIRQELWDGITAPAVFTHTTLSGMAEVIESGINSAATDVAPVERGRERSEP